MIWFSEAAAYPSRTKIGSAASRIACLDCAARSTFVRAMLNAKNRPVGLSTVTAYWILGAGPHLPPSLSAPHFALDRRVAPPGPGWRDELRGNPRNLYGVFWRRRAQLCAAAHRPCSRRSLKT